MNHSVSNVMRVNENLGPIAQKKMSDEGINLKGKGMLIKKNEIRSVDLVGSTITAISPNGTFESHVPRV